MFTRIGILTATVLTAIVMFIMIETPTAEAAGSGNVRGRMIGITEHDEAIFELIAMARGNEDTLSYDLTVKIQGADEWWMADYGVGSVSPYQRDRGGFCRSAPLPVYHCVRTLSAASLEARRDTVRLVIHMQPEWRGQYRHALVITGELNGRPVHESVTVRR